MATTPSKPTKTVTINYTDPAPGAVPQLQILNDVAGNVGELQIKGKSGRFDATNNLAWNDNSQTLNIRGNVRMTGNIVGNLVGNPSYLKLIGGNVGDVLSTDGAGNLSWQTMEDVGGYGNTEVAAYLPTFNGNLKASNANLGNSVTANHFIGSGNLLTGFSNVARTGNYTDLTNKPNLVSNLTSLSDVTISTPANGQTLTYNGNEWVNANGADALWNWQGAYSAGPQYQEGDIVSYQGSTYRRNNVGNSVVGELPTNTTYWQVVAQRGTDGNDGDSYDQTLNTTDAVVFDSVTVNGVVEAKDHLTITSTDVDVLYDTYLERVALLEDYFSQGIGGTPYTGAGSPPSKLSYAALIRAKALNPLIPDAWLPAAQSLRNAYFAWAGSSITITPTSGGVTLENGDGVGFRYDEGTGLRFPDNTFQTTAFTGANTGNITFTNTTMSSSNGDVKISFSPTASPAVEFTFADNGTLILPGGIVLENNQVKNTGELSGEVQVTTATTQGDTEKNWKFNHNGAGTLIVPEGSSVQSKSNFNITATEAGFIKFTNIVDFDTNSSVDDNQINIVNPESSVLDLIDPASANYAGGLGSKVRIVYGPFRSAEGTIIEAFADPGTPDPFTGLPRYQGRINIVNPHNGDLLKEFSIENSSSWKFGSDGKLTLPEGGDIVDSTGISVLGGGVTFSGNYNDLTNKPTIPEISKTYTAGNLVQNTNLSVQPQEISLTATLDAGFGPNENTIGKVRVEAGAVNLSSVDQDAPDVEYKSEINVSYSNGVTITNTPGNVDPLNWVFKTDGRLQLPAGGIVTETVVTDNPTIVIGPANPDVNSQALFIKGGGPGFINTQNGISIQTIYNLYAIGDTVSFNIWTPDNSNSTLYWWLEPAGGGAAPITPVSGTVLINEFGASDASIDVEVLSTAPFRIYVGPTNNVAGTAGISVSVNGEAGPVDYHLHLTTGDLEETSIILGTDDHNVRTKPDGAIELNSRNYETDQVKTWAFDTAGDLILPAGGDIKDSTGNSVLGGGGATSLADLEDVQLEGPVEGSVLTWNASTQKWENRTPSGGSGGDPAYKGFKASYGRMWGNSSGPINKIVIYKDTATPSSTIDTSTENDNFTVTGLSGSDVVVMLVAIGEDENQITTSELKTFAEYIIDNVILDGGVEGDVNTAAGMKSAFYANFSIFSATLTDLKANFQFFGSPSSPQYTINNFTYNGSTGTGASFGSLQYSFANSRFEVGGWGNGTGYVVGDTFTILGTDIVDVATGLTLASPANDTTITVNSIIDIGYLDTFTVTSGIPVPADPGPNWPSNYIDDGGNDEYDSGNYINTNLDTEISYNSGNVVSGSSAFGGGDYVVTYKDSIFGVFAVNANISSISTTGGSGFDGSGQADTGSLYGAASGVSIGDFAFNGSTMTASDDNLYIKAVDDLYLDALADDVHIRANDDVRIKVGYDFEDDSAQREWRFDTGGYINFPDGSQQNTAWTGSVDYNDVNNKPTLFTSDQSVDTTSSVTFANVNVTGTVSSAIIMLEAYASETYTLPGSFTEDICRYSIVSSNVNVPTSWFDTSTYRFTPQKAGYWQITASYDVYRNSEASLAIKKNADIVAAAGSFNAVAQQITKIVYLNGSTDYINIINVGGAALQRPQFDSRSWFQARWIGT